MLAKDTLRRNKTDLQLALCADHRLILDKVLERNLITQREYNNLKDIKGENVEGHVVALVDKIMNKGEDTCKSFLGLLQTDEQITTTLTELKHIRLSDTSLLSTPVQVSSSRCDDAPQSKKQKKDEVYELKSRPVGLCVIINNENFLNDTQKKRKGTDEDARSLAEVFTWLGFRVLVCKDQTSDQMRRVLKSFSSLGAGAQPQGLGVEEWSDGGFTAPQQDIKHGDAFFCCILSHGTKGSVLGTDSKPVGIKDITRTFKATDESALTGKPKVFLIQACQGNDRQKGVLMKDVEMDGDLSVPAEADHLVAVSTVEDFVSYRCPENGSWFIQSVCQQLRERCPKGEDFTSILLHVNREVGQKEGALQPGEIKQISEVKFTLTKRLVLSPRPL